MTATARSEEGRYWSDLVDYLSEPEGTPRWPAGVSVPKRPLAQTDPKTARRLSELSALGRKVMSLKRKPKPITIRPVS